MTGQSETPSTNDIFLKCQNLLSLPPPQISQREFFFVRENEEYFGIRSWLMIWDT
jgi:hypothetical protein